MSEVRQAFLAEPFSAACFETVPDACGFVIAGASGDLAKRKLIPALYQLYRQQLMPNGFYILGFARSAYTTDDFRRYLSEEVSHQPDDWAGFIRHIHYQPVDYADASAFRSLSEALIRLGDQYGTQNRLFYLATPPTAATALIVALGEAGLLTETALERRWVRLITEKPFGTSLATAHAARLAMQRYLQEHQIYRIDHYLGKETVQNILISRFANTLFEPLWNRQYVDHIQITAAEAIGIETRAGYYEQAGAVRDMFQNHILQVMALVAMEPPSVFAADRYRDEKVKLLRSIRPLSLAPDTDAIRGQYSAGGAQPAYRAEPGVSPTSQRETYAALRLFVDNWRWAGVPFYLRSGKSLTNRLTEVAVHFKPVPHSMFQPLLPEQLSTNTLVFAIQPEEGIHLSLEAKRPGPRLCMGCLKLRVNYRDLDEPCPSPERLDAYARLLLDAMSGDQTLFVRADDVEQAWTLLDPLLSAWERQPEKYPLHSYPAGTAGPKAADELLAKDGRRWRPL